MTREEYQKCEWAANMYHDKVHECNMLRRKLAQMEERLAQKERENQLLKERLGYKRACDVQYSKDDAEVFLILKMRSGV